MNFLIHHHVYVYKSTTRAPLNRVREREQTRSRGPMSATQYLKAGATRSHATRTAAPAKSPAAAAPPAFAECAPRCGNAPHEKDVPPSHDKGTEPRIDSKISEFAARHTALLPTRRNLQTGSNTPANSTGVFPLSLPAEERYEHSRPTAFRICSAASIEPQGLKTLFRHTAMGSLISPPISLRTHPLPTPQRRPSRLHRLSLHPH